MQAKFNPSYSGVQEPRDQGPPPRGRPVFLRACGHRRAPGSFRKTLSNFAGSERTWEKFLHGSQTVCPKGTDAGGGSYAPPCRFHTSRSMLRERRVLYYHGGPIQPWPKQV